MKLILILLLISIMSGCAIVPAGGYYEGYSIQPYPVYVQPYGYEPYRYHRLPHHHHNHW